jgi:heme A synthase
MRQFARFVWFVLVYDVAVVLWGAYVRVSFSGDGCGAHWPLCNGELVPHAQQTKTLVELAHRVTSGGSLVVAIVLFVWALRIAPKRSDVRRYSAWVLFFTASEALIGAAIVLLRLVAHDKSLVRGVSTSLHLTNTFLLLACIAITTRVATGAPALAFRKRGWLGVLSAAAIFVTIFIAATGSIAALGDTLYPSHSVAEGLAQDVAPSAPLFIRLRSLHPFIAVFGGVLLLGLASFAPAARPTRDVQRLGRALSVAYFVQVALGVINIRFLAPTGLQLLHLLSADVVWVLLVLLSTAALGEAAPTTSSPKAALAGSPPVP